MQATEYQIELLQHALGISADRHTPHRNHFVAGNSSHDMKDLTALEKVGLMTRSPTPQFCASSDVLFLVTEKGIALATERLPQPSPKPKRSRYREYLDADYGCSFSQYLCGDQQPKLETRSRGIAMEYRMFRNKSDSYRGTYRDVEGNWASTKKEAKASYKAKLKELRLNS